MTDGLDVKPPPPSIQLTQLRETSPAPHLSSTLSRWTDVAVETVASARQCPLRRHEELQQQEEEETISLKGWRICPWSTSTLYWL